MKVLLTTPNLEKAGGVASFYATLKDHFSGEVEYFTVGTRTVGDRSASKWRRLRRDYWELYKRLKSGEYDVLHVDPSLRPKALLRDGVSLVMAKLLHIKVVVYMHGWDWGWDRVIRRYFRLLFAVLYGKADAFIVQSVGFRESLEDIGWRPRVYIETTTVPDEAFAYANEASQRLMTVLSRDRFNILFLARVEKVKGVYEALDAYNILKRKYPFVTMTIAGDGSELARVKEYVRLGGIEGVDFLGWVSGDAKYRAYAASDVYLFPTFWHEGMPNSVLEAMACGLPVVTRPVGGGS